MRSGLVSGTFSPPHAGHHFLIDTARAHVERLTVVVWERAGQPISAALRARWLREIHPDVDVVVAPAGTALDAAGRAAVLRDLLGAAPDVLFTSQPGAQSLAQAYGCAIVVVVDPLREMFPVRAARIRRDPLASLEWLTPNVRAYYVRRVCAIGSESTGKTTLCERLAQRFGAPWVGEYGRDYTLVKQRTADANVWRADEFVHIAREQQRREDEAARAAPGLVVCDTDAFATEIWLERYLGPQDARGWPVRDRPLDLYLLTDPNVPFVADAIRDGEHLRGWMFTRMREELGRRALPYTVLSGTYEQREQHAITAIESLLASTVPGSAAHDATTPGMQR